MSDSGGQETGTRILAVVTARGGSKSIPHKNLVSIGGMPLIEYSIRTGLASTRVDRVVVSTDDEQIAAVSTAAGAEVPFVRPAEFAEDSTPTLPVLQHCLDELLDRESYRPDGVLLLQPTSPLRTRRHIDEAVDLFIEHRPTSVVSVVEVPHNFNPVSLMKLENGFLTPWMEGQGTTILRRQDKPRVLARNGPAILITRTETLLDEGDLYGDRPLPYMMSALDSVDIDSPEDIGLVEYLLRRHERADDTGGLVL